MNRIHETPNRSGAFSDQVETGWSPENATKQEPGATERFNLNKNCSGHRFSVAPMVDWTDRHCRYFHRLLTRKACLYTEMIVADAVVRGDRDRLLSFSEEEHPVALQLGGSDPATLMDAARIGAGYGYDEINLNVGCPSDQVQAGMFGAVLMRAPERVAACIARMQGAVGVPVTVKCRLGVDEQLPEETLFDFIETVSRGGCRRFIIHARKAWLQGLSPRKNRDVPPLDYAIVYRLKETFPQFEIVLNGGLQSIEEACCHQRGLDGVMMGRAAYARPYELTGVDRLFYGDDFSPPSRVEVIDAMTDYLASNIDRKHLRAHHVTRHMTGLFHGHAGARKWRRLLSEQIPRDDVPITALNETAQAILSDAA